MTNLNQSSPAQSNPLLAFIGKNTNRMKAIATDPLNNWPATWLSQKIFANTAGMKSNLNGAVALARARRRNPATADEKYGELGEKLAVDGVVSVPGLYPKDLIEQVAEGCRHIYDTEVEPTVNRVVIDGKVYRTGYSNPHLHIPRYLEFVDDRVRGIVTSYLRSEMEVFDTRTWRNLHVPDEICRRQEVLSSHWHCDTIESSTVKLFVILSEVTDADGPLHVMTHPATREALRLGYQSRDDLGAAADFMTDPENFIKLVGPPGTAVLCRSSICFHKAGVPEFGHTRDIAETRMRPFLQPSDHRD